MSEPAVMDLQARIDAELKQAMRDRNEVTKLTLRAVKTALTEARTAGSSHELTEDEILAVIQKEAKRRRDAAAEYLQYGDDGRAAAELAELEVLANYLPRQLTEEEIEILARQTIDQVGATSQKDLGAVMSVMVAKVKGQADGKVVNQIVRRLLST